MALRQTRIVLIIFQASLKDSGISRPLQNRNCRCAQASLLRRLARTHRLAVVSNIWSPRQIWLEEFNRAGIDGVFRCQVFSSDYRSIKPSPVLFREALRGLGAGPEESLFIGDSLRCDMEGARQAGIATAWITPETKRPESVDYLISDIQKIERPS